jgi:ataxia telangiectasia mutated family protein
MQGEGKSWLVVFQALFEAVQIEREAYRKKPSPATANRLNHAAGTVRWLTERSVHRWNKKVSKALISHLLHTIMDKDELRLPVALDYINALRCLVSRQAHLDHLDDENWVFMAELAFNVVLRDPLRKSLESDEGEDDEGGGIQGDDSEFYDDDEDDANEMPSTSTFVKSKKRRRPTPRATAQRATSRSKSKALSDESKPTTSEQKACTSLLAILLRASSAPLLSELYPNIASSVLHRLKRFLYIYPLGTSLHEDYLLALTATLSHLSLNKKGDVEAFAHASWDGLIGLWGTKTKRLKESLVIVLRMLFPFLTADENNTWGQRIGKLWQLLYVEADSRWGVDGLNLESIRLEVASDEGRARSGVAFVAKTFRAGWHFDEAQALAWAILELQADCAEKVI